MITFQRYILDNGLKVLVHEDDSTPMVAVNVLYDVGSRDEAPDKTGFAHLFEHLMFGGSAHIPDFDDPIQLAGGENNAFTNSDLTSFYNVLPARNIETAFWLESDRMLKLRFNKKVLGVQRKVVVEEFKETCLNQPYGDAWHHISDLAYKAHPYRWPTIGLEPSHIEQATLDDVKQFYYAYYRPNNAILVIAGNVKSEEAVRLAEKWFGSIPAGQIPDRHIPAEPPQTEQRRRVLHADVPSDALYLAFHMAERMSPQFYASDLITDALGNGPSARLFRRLLKEQKFFAHIDCYLSATHDPGLLIIEGKPSEGVSLEQAEALIWQELEQLRTTPLPEVELQKLKNKVESSLVFSELSALNKAINLATFELLGDAHLINEEVRFYQNVTTEDMHQVATQLFRPENCSVLHYVAPRPALN